METNFSRWNLKNLDLRIREDENNQEKGMTFSNNRLQNVKKTNLKERKQPHQVVFYRIYRVMSLLFTA